MVEQLGCKGPERRITAVGRIWGLSMQQQPSVGVAIGIDFVTIGLIPTLVLISGLMIFSRSGAGGRALDIELRFREGPQVRATGDLGRNLAVQTITVL